MSRREEITIAARALLEEQGEDALTMRNLADRRFDLYSVDWRAPA